MLAPVKSSLVTMLSAPPASPAWATISLLISVSPVEPDARTVIAPVHALSAWWTTDLTLDLALYALLSARPAQLMTSLVPTPALSVILSMDPS